MTDESKSEQLRATIGWTLRTFDDPMLKRVCNPVGPNDPIDKILSQMRRAMVVHKAAGLAAPQIGYPLRIAIVGRTVLINPILTWQSAKVELGEEACLSYPGVVATEVMRRLSVRISYTRDDGKRVREGMVFAGWDARVAQHELDHLDGICRVGDVWRELKAVGLWESEKGSRK